MTTTTKIPIPKTAESYIDGNYFYVEFNRKNESEFLKWCEDNNIGHGEDYRKDITKSYLSVFTPIWNKSVFE